MLDGLNQFVHRLYVTFINLMHVTTIPIVIALSVASGFTTFGGMRLYINEWIALAVTFAVQSILVLAAFELSNTYFRAHRLRFLFLLLSLLIAVSVSINFSYIMFYEKSRGASEKVEKFERMDDDIQAYIAEVKRIKSEAVAEKLARIEELKRQSQSRLREAPPRDAPRSQWYRWRLLYESDNKELVAEKEELATLVGRFEQDVEPRVSSFLAGTWRQEIINDAAGYTRAVTEFDVLTNLIGDGLSRAGRTPVKSPVITPWELFNQLSPPYAFLSQLPLLLAFVIDILIFLFSWRLKSLPFGVMSEEEKELAYYGIKQFTGHRIGRDDRLQFRITKTGDEESEDYDDKLRTNILALLMTKGYAKRVDGQHVELSPRFDDTLAKKLSDELVSNRPRVQPVEVTARAADSAPTQLAAGADGARRGQFGKGGYDG
jgi:hypothetical protein